MRGALALLRDRPQFRVLWAALALSYTGSGAALTVLTLYVQQTRGTGTAVAALLIAGSAPRLLGPLAGSLADRFDLRRLMIGADLGQAVLFVLLASLPPFAAIIALVTLATCLETTYAPAKATAVPALVGDDELLLANSLTGVAANLYVAIGPLVGGLLFAAGGAAVALLFNAATFLASALLTRAVAPLPPADREEGRERESLLLATRTGLRHAFANRVTRVVTLALLFMFAFVSIDNVALVFLVRDTLDGGSAAYGVVSAIFGAGMLVGSVGVMRGSRTSPVMLYLLALILSSVGTVATGVAPAILLVAIAQFASGSGNGIEIVASDTIFQQHVPRHLLGRVYGLTATATAVGSGIAMALGGFLVDATSPRFAFVVAGAGGLLVTACAAPALLRAHST
jgi:MFS family permease